MTYGDLKIGQKFFAASDLNRVIYIVTDMDTALDMRTGRSRIFSNKMLVIPLDSHKIFRLLYDGKCSL